MKFCDKCGNLMIQSAKMGKSGHLCRKCNHFVADKKATSTVVDEKMDQGEDRIKVIRKDEDYEKYPKTRIECPECGHMEAYWYMQQTRGADEPQTKFFSCVKCGHKWREYD